MILLCYWICNLLENAHNVEDIWYEIMKCVNVDANESERFDDVIIHTSNTNEPLACDENVYWHFELVEMQA